VLSAIGDRVVGRPGVLGEPSATRVAFLPPLRGGVKPNVASVRFGPLTLPLLNAPWFEGDAVYRRRPKMRQGKITERIMRQELAAAAKRRTHVVET
jgi:hypothetical protein